MRALWQKVATDFRVPLLVLVIGSLLALVDGAFALTPVMHISPFGLLVAAILAAVFLWTGHYNEEKPETVQALARGCCRPPVTYSRMLPERVAGRGERRP